MGRTFADDLAADGERIFFNAEEFGENWIHIPPTGDQASFVGVFEEFQPADPTSDQAGDRNTRSGLLHCPTELSVSLAQQAKSKFLRGQETWYPTGVSHDGCTQIVHLSLNSVHSFRGGPRQRTI